MLNIFRGSRPDITPAFAGGFLLAGVPIVANLLHVFGVFTVTVEQQNALTDAIQWGVVGGGALAIGDAGLRASRNSADAKRDAAALTAPTPAPPAAPADPALEALMTEDDLPTDDEEFGGDAPVTDDGLAEAARPVMPSQVALEGEPDEDELAP